MKSKNALSKAIFLDDLIQIDGKKFKLLSNDSESRNRCGIKINDNCDVEIYLEEGGRAIAGNGLIVSATQRSKNNMIIIGRNAKITGKILFNGSDNLFYSHGDTPYPIGSLVDFRYNASGSLIEIKERFTSNGLTCVLGDNTAIRIGEDSMVSHNVSIYTTDMHAIFDVRTKKVLNVPQCVTIADHVWLGKDCMITKGASIGSGAIIGAKALVANDVPKCSVSAGVPNLTIRENVSWARPQNPNNDQFDKLLLMLSL